MMKRILLLVLFLSLFVFSGCNTDSSSIEHTSQDADNTVTAIKLVYKPRPETEVVLSNEQAEYMLSIWNSNGWEDDITKTACEYHFKFNEKVIRYSPEAGVFNDWENYRHMVVPKEVRDRINAFVIVDVAKKINK